MQFVSPSAEREHPSTMERRRAQSTISPSTLVLDHGQGRGAIRFQLEEDKHVSPSPRDLPSYFALAIPRPWALNRIPWFSGIGQTRRSACGPAGQRRRSTRAATPPEDSADFVEDVAVVTGLATFWSSSASCNRDS